MKVAIKITQTHLDNNPELLEGLSVNDIKVFETLPNVWNNGTPFKNKSKTQAEAFGFFEVITPEITFNQKLGQIAFNTDKFTYPIIDLTQTEIAAKIFELNKGLLIHRMDETFNIKNNQVSNVAIESEKEYNEFTGLKEQTTYVNDINDVVVKKHFEIYDHNNRKGTKLTIDFYDGNGNVSESIITKDYYSDKQIKDFRGKCTIRVYERLLWDFDVELATIEFIVEHYDTAKKNALLPILGLPDIATLDAIPSLLNNLFHDLFKVLLKEEIDTMYKTGDSTELFNAVSTLVYIPLDQQALTSDQAVKYTYRQILQAKFNPSNFNFYGS